MAEGLAGDDFRGARARQIDIDDALRLAGPVGHHQDAVGHLHRFGDVVGDQQRGLFELLLDLQHLVAEQEPRLLVERGEGLVHQQDFRLGGERAGQRNALAHAAGQFAGIAVLEAGQTDQCDEMPRAFGALRARHAGEFEREGDIVEHRAPGERGFLLEHHADRLVRAVDGLAGDADHALMMVEQAADHVEQSRFAAARGADDREEFARPDLERDVVDRRDRAFRRVVAHDNVVHQQDGVIGVLSAGRHGHSLLRVIAAVTSAV